MKYIYIYYHFLFDIYSAGYKQYDPAYYFFISIDSFAYYRPSVIFVNPILIASNDTFLYSFQRELPIITGCLTNTQSFYFIDVPIYWF